ncbi:MAG: transcription antitermination factor NusB [Lachnospiraceae bacterium]
MNENERPASNAGEKRSDRRLGGKFDGQRRPYAGKPEGHRPAVRRRENARKDEKNVPPTACEARVRPRKFDRDGQHRSQPSENRSFDKKTDRPSYGRPASGKPSYEEAFFWQTFLSIFFTASPSGPRKPAAPAEPGARKLALKVLLDVHENGAYAALSLNKTLPRDLKPEERRLTTQLVYGTLENEVKIDHALNQLTEYPARDAVTRDALRLGVYQIMFLERVPDSAAVDESVKLVKDDGHGSLCGLCECGTAQSDPPEGRASRPDAEKTRRNGSCGKLRPVDN